MVWDTKNKVRFWSKTSSLDANTNAPFFCGRILKFHCGIREGKKTYEKMNEYLSGGQVKQKKKSIARTNCVLDTHTRMRACVYVFIYLRLLIP